MLPEPGNISRESKKVFGTQKMVEEAILDWKLELTSQLKNQVLNQSLLHQKDQR